MKMTRPSVKLTHAGARVIMDAAIAYAEQMGVPQCIAIVDEGCNLLAFTRMDGARVLSVRSSQRKAMTAATTGQPTGGLDPANEMKLAVVTNGEMVNLKGGLPIIVDGYLIGGIGVGSGTGDQDLEVAKAALEKFAADARA